MSAQWLGRSVEWIRVFMTDAAAKPGELRDPAYGWVMVVVVLLLSALSLGGLGAVGVFLKPLAAEFGWGRGETALGYTAISIGAAVMGPIWGYMADKYGSRPLAFIGVGVLTLSMWLQSNTTSLWQFYASYLLFGGLGLSALGGPLLANVGFWFRRNPGLAIGLTTAGGALGQAIIPYGARLLISSYDWQTAYFAMAGLFLVVGLPLCFLVRESPWRLAQLGKDTAEETPHDFPLPPVEVISWICLAVVFCCICMAVPLVHVVAMVSDRGIQPETAASVFMVLMIAGIFGRILGGKACDLIGALPTYMIAAISQACLAFLFPHIASLTGLYVLAVLYGISYSAIMSSFMVCIRMMVPPGIAARGTGFVSSFGMLGMGIGGYAGGALFDVTGDYVWSYTAAGMAGLVNFGILCMFLLRIRLARQALQGTMPQMPEVAAKNHQDMPL